MDTTLQSSTQEISEIKLINVTKNYHLGKTVVSALQNINLNISKGEFTVIAGPSGSGKTTLLNLIGCVDVATSGEVHVSGEQTNNLKETDLTKLRLHSIGFIFQSFNLIPVLNVYDNIEFPLLLRKDISKTERVKATKEFIEKVGLTNFTKHRPSELSGGQRQRVAIARALVSNPKIILADEPTANLDSHTGNSIIELMKNINKDLKTTFVFSTHDEKIIQQAKRVIRLHDGQII